MGFSLQCVLHMCEIMLDTKNILVHKHQKISSQNISIGAKLIALKPIVSKAFDPIRSGEVYLPLCCKHVYMF
jgi:hypothetical protein